MNKCGFLEDIYFSKTRYRFLTLWPNRQRRGRWSSWDTCKPSRCVNHIVMRVDAKCMYLVIDCDGITLLWNMTDSCECSSRKLLLLNPSNAICRGTYEELYRLSMLVMLERSANVFRVHQHLFVKCPVLCFGGITSHVTASLHSLQLILGLFW